MLKELIDTLSFMYCYAARSRGKLSREELGGIRAGANAMSAHAAEVLLEKDKAYTPEQESDLAEIDLIDEHIEEIVAWLLSVENF